ncbi:MAG TPA: hypothetical protein VGR37_15215 [Longimicrobiaceae bacterium]|nr:hypothetical protein [Longimicrobiaceae bacterium]
MDPRIREEVVSFLRAWLPEDAREGYRRMVERDPEGWHRHPHFAEGVIVRHALRGNGFTEELLGVASLEPYWADLLAQAVRGDDAPPPPAG